MSFAPNFETYESLRFDDAETGLAIDLSAFGISRADFDAFEPRFERVFAEMRELEGGAIANADEGRRVGHYWLRASACAPGELGAAIDAERASALAFARSVLDGELCAANGEPFEAMCLIGIGGSALGPQLVIDALQDPGRGLRFVSLDNTDPDGIARSLASIDLARTLFVVISKSGGTKETRNAMLEARAACASAGVAFAAHAVAVTGIGSQLDRNAEEERWIQRFPMHDWVGGRTSVCSAVGLLPAALCGVDMDALLDGAAAMDASTRGEAISENPAAQLAIACWIGAEGRGARNMVVLPYADRLLLLGRYLQQLVMESLGKEHDRDGAVVEQGLTVYGNKGSTDQHACVQQLRDGVEDFFACFVRVLDDGVEDALEVEAGVSSADYLHGFYLGTRRALAEKKRRSLTITVPRVDARVLGMLIALFERCVGYYASLANINAYHQPGVEAGKRGAAEALELRARILEALGAESRSIEDLAAACASEDLVTTALLLEQMAANPDWSRVERDPSDGGYRRK